MKRQSTARWMLAALAAGTTLAGGFATPSFADQDFKTTTPVKHVVIVFNENISFDHYFATYPNAANPAGEPQFNGRDDTPSVNGLTAGLLTNNPNKLQPIRLDRSEAFTCDEDHGYTDEQKAADGGLMDLFIQVNGNRTSQGCRPNGQTVMGYYDGNTVTALWNYAQHFSMSDDSFDTEYGPSTPGALDLVAGQTRGGLALLGGVTPVTTPNSLQFFGQLFIDVNSVAVAIGDPDPALDDCGVDAGGTNNTLVTYQLGAPNIGNALNAKGITWGWFQGGFAPTATATLNGDGSTKTPAVCGAFHMFPATTPNPPAQDTQGADIHLKQIKDYVAHHEPFQYFPSTRNVHHVRPSSPGMIGHDDMNTVDGSANGPKFPVNHQYDISDFFTALSSGNLPAVSYIKPPALQDAHPANSTPLDEQRFLVHLINALQQSPEWKETAVIVLYDDSDGWYDHVFAPLVSPSVSIVDSLVPFNPAQPVGSVLPANATSPAQIATSGLCATPGTTAVADNSVGRCGYGARQPLLVISPWSKRNFVDHSLTDQTSTLRFIEENFGLGFVDGKPALALGAPLGSDSFDHIAGSIMNMFDFDDHPNLDPVILDETTGAVVDNDHDQAHHDHD